MASRGPSNPTPSAPPSPSARYAYLVARLRNRQITMEEATELFALMDETIHALRSATVRASPPPSARGTSSPSATAPPASREAARGIATDDLLTAGVLLIGAGAGVAAALRRRGSEGPKKTGPAAPLPERKSSEP